MKTIAVLAQKGGSGKTTLTVHLAVLAGQRGQRVAVLDCDPQRSALDWYQARESEMPTMVEAGTDQLGEILDTARGDDYDLALIDTAPHAEAGIVAAARAADFCLVPCRPAVLDLRAIGKTVEILQKINAPFAVVLNACPPSRGFGEASIVTEARAALGTGGVPTLTATATQRAAFSHALIDGRAVTEFAPGSRAAAEINTLLNEIMETL